MILCLIAASLTATAVVHANETSDAITIECSGFVHTDGDADQSQGDADQAMPHHHGGCHGAASLLPPSAGALDSFDLMTAQIGHRGISALYRWSPEPGLRPPIA